MSDDEACQNRLKDLDAQFLSLVHEVMHADRLAFEEAKHRAWILLVQRAARGDEIALRVFISAYED